jgi:hypothetical protein
MKKRIKYSTLMKETNSKAEVANWCIVNALRLPNELIVSIAAKLMQHLTDDEREKVLRLSGVVGQREQLNTAWKALEWVGFTRGEEFADDDVAEMLGI